MPAPLLKRVAAGDAEAVRTCLERYTPLVWSMARRWLHDDAQAEDTVQEIFIQVWKSAAGYDPKIASERTWIGTIARRRLIDQRRKLGAAPEVETLDVEEASEEDSGLSGVATGEEAQVALRAMEKLEPGQKRVLLLSIMEGLSHGQIAAKTGQPLGTVKTQLRTGLKRLRGMLQVVHTPTSGRVMS